MRTEILEMLNAHFPDEYFSECLHPDNIRWNTASEIHQLICDSMATAMYRCLEQVPLDKEKLAKVRLAEYGFSKEEIEKSISKLENEIKLITDEHIREAAQEHAQNAFFDLDVGIYTRSAKSFAAGADWARKRDNWIPVAEKLPEEDAWTVAIVYNNPFFGKMTQERGAARYCHEDRKWISELTGGRLMTIEVHNVTHWQPLPEFPKTEQ